MIREEIEQLFFSNLSGVRAGTGGQYYAKCPFHDDKHSSFSFNVENGGWTCHAEDIHGGPEAFANKIGVAPTGSQADRQNLNIVATYDYKDEQGKLLFQVVRVTPKGFRQRRPGSAGDWHWDLEGVRRVLYRLPELVEIGQGESQVLVVEGEKDVETLRGLGLVATCNPGGAGKWKPEYSPFLAGKHVVILPDNDEPGLKHSKQVVESLLGVAASVKLVMLPGATGKGADVTDWLKQGHTLHELLKVCDATPTLKATNLAVPSEKNWEQPLPFQTLKLPEFPTEILPGWLREFVEDEAHSTQTPHDLAGLLALAACACACAKKVLTLVRGGWIEPLNIYVAVALPPGSRKTRIFSAIEEPLNDYEAEKAKELGPIVAEAEARHKIEQGRLNKLQAKAGAAKEYDRDSLIQEATELAVELSNTKLPKLPRLVADDVTPESLSTLLKDHDGKLAVLSAEGGVFDLMAGRYSGNGAPNFEVFLKAHAGDTLRVDRIGRPPEYVMSPALTMGLAVQPEVLSGLAGKPGFKGRGLLGRFLYALPPSLLGRRKVGASSLLPHARAAYNTTIRKLLEASPARDQDGREVARLLKYSPEAQAKHLEFEAWVEPQLGPYGPLGFMSDWGGKLAGAVARLAGILHMAEHSADPTPWTTLISEETVNRAIRLGKYLIPHARAAYASMGADPEVEDAKLLLGWITEQSLAVFSKRDIHQALKGHFKQVATLEPPLRLLEEHGYIRRKEAEVRHKPGRKPSTEYEVNPACLARPEVAPTTVTDSENTEDSEQVPDVRMDRELGADFGELVPPQPTEQNSQNTQKPDTCPLDPTGGIL